MTFNLEIHQREKMMIFCIFDIFHTVLQLAFVDKISVTIYAIFYQSFLDLVRPPPVVNVANLKGRGGV